MTRKYKQANNIDIKKNLVKKAYSNEKVIKKYSKIGLWKSENYLINSYFMLGINKVINNVRILDIGCGCGRTTIPIKMKGYDVIGVDLSSDMIANARNISTQHKLKIDFEIMDTCNLIFPDEFFDNVLFSYNGIEHIPTYNQKIKALKEIYRVLRLGGRLIFTVHSGIPFIKTFCSWLVRTFDSKILADKEQLPKPLEFGERYYNRYVPESIYTHIIPVFYWWKWLKSIGFELEYINTRERVRKHLHPSKFHSLFYPFEIFMVCKKKS